MSLFFVQDADFSLFVRADLGAQAVELWRSHYRLAQTATPARLFAINDDGTMPGAIPWNCINGVFKVREWREPQQRAA